MKNLDWSEILLIAGGAVCISVIMICAYFAGVDKRAHALECAKLKGYWNGEVCHAVKP